MFLSQADKKAAIPFTASLSLTFEPSSVPVGSPLAESMVEGVAADKEDQDSQAEARGGFESERHLLTK